MKNQIISLLVIIFLFNSFNSYSSENNWNGEGGNLVLVTHYVIILAITGETTRSGEIVITDKNFKVLSKINTF